MEKTLRKLAKDKFGLNIGGNERKLRGKPEKCDMCGNKTERLDLYYSRLERTYIWVCERKDCCYRANFDFYYKVKGDGKG